MPGLYLRAATVSALCASAMGLQQYLCPPLSTENGFAIPIHPEARTADCRLPSLRRSGHGQCRVKCAYGWELSTDSPNYIKCGDDGEWVGQDNVTCIELVKPGYELVVPDVLDSFGMSLLDIVFNKQLKISRGMTVPATRINSKPVITWRAQPRDMAEYYSLAIVDPDAPTRKNPVYRSCIHWLVVNIPNPGGAKIDEGEEIFPFMHTAPAEGTGEHRYVYILWKQSEGKLEFKKEYRYKYGAELQYRLKWDARAFAARNGLGKPAAMVYYKAEYEKGQEVGVESHHNKIYAAEIPSIEDAFKSEV